MYIYCFKHTLEIRKEGFIVYDNTCQKINIMLKPWPNGISLKGLRKRAFYSINFFGMSIVVGLILTYPLRHI